MTTPAVQQLPMVPPRPSKSPIKDISANGIPIIPPRPGGRRIDRSRSPNHDRFAPSPLGGGFKANSRYSPPNAALDIGDALDRSRSLPMPSVGEEGIEYSAYSKDSDSKIASPEHTRSVGEDLKLHAPKPSLPAESAKQRLQAVTRTDSDKAASFGIGRPGAERSLSRDGLKKRHSANMSTTSDHAYLTDDEQGIPEIGQRVPMNPNLGDVQAPSPAPDSHRVLSRKPSSRSLPPGSYGMHGHGSVPLDELEKAYYKKHPDLFFKERSTPIHDRQNDFAMSSSELNKLVRDTGSAEHRGTPHDAAAFQASEEYTTRKNSPNGTPTLEKTSAEAAKSSEDAIHVDDPQHPEYISYGVEGAAETTEDEYNAPILASDEVLKDPKGHMHHPAVRPVLERNDSSYDGRPNSRPNSRPSSRPGSIYNSSHLHDVSHTTLEDVEEYEPLFPEEAAKKEQEQKEKTEKLKARHYFPSKDVWEDAPNSVFDTAEVSTPENADEHPRKTSAQLEGRSETPAHAFARQHEELAEKESQRRTNNFLPLVEDPKPWNDRRTQSVERSGRRSESARRFPSKDIWEDAPESSLQEAEVVEAEKDDRKPEVPARPAKKSAELLQRPVVPERPKSRSSNKEDVAQAAPKPVVPARPVKKAVEEPKEAEAAAPQQPAAAAATSRPVGGRIAALQAGFMSDLNKRLQLGPTAPKKEEPAEEAEAKEPEEKAPLVDARKSRARGPQRRAPTKAAAPADSTPSAPVLTFSLPQTTWSINPDDSDFVIPSNRSPDFVPEPESVVEPSEEAAPEVEKKEERLAGSETLTGPAEAHLAAKGSEAVPVSEEPKEAEASIEKVETVAEEAPKPEKEETLVSNTAGESILEAKVETSEANEIEPVEVKDEVKA